MGWIWDAVLAAEYSWLGEWVRESEYGYYLMLGGHAVGMVLVVGVVMMLNIRVLGYAPGVSLATFDRLVALAWFGFILNAATGVVLFIGSADRLILNPEFDIKIILIAIGGVLVWYLRRTLRGGDNAATGGKVGLVPLKGRLIALSSVMVWTAAIVAGRLIAYTLQPPPPPTL